MNEFIHFLKFLGRKKAILIIVPLLTVIGSYFIVKKLPDYYKSQGRIATGLVDKTEEILASGKDAEQESEINRKFDNLIQLMRLKKVIDQVSYRLILHDLTAKSDSLFKNPKAKLEGLDGNAKRRAVEIFSAKLKQGEELSLWNKEEKILQEILEESGYDHNSILDKLTIYRVQNSDYINIEFEGTNPRLTAFTINTLCEEFLSMYSNRLRESNDRSLDFLEKFMLQKLEALNGRMEVLKKFKIQNRVLNLNEQARSLYGHIIDFETKREIAKKDVAAYSSALKNIDSKFDPADRRYLESSMSSINQDIASTREQMRNANDAYIKSGFSPVYKSRLDSLQQILSLKIGESTDKYIFNPLVAKENLVSRKLDLEISLELSQNSIQSIEAEISRLNRKFDGMVPNEASIQQFETGIDIAGKEYIEALQRYNSARLESNYPVALKQVEKAMPGVIQPSKKVMLIALSGIVSLVLCLFVLFVLYYFDRSIWTSAQLANQTGIPVLGQMNKTDQGLDMLSAVNQHQTHSGLDLLKNQFRSLRYEIDEEIHGPKLVAVTSLHDAVTKTSLIRGLAWAYAKVSQRVLVIDGDFEHQSLADNASSPLLEDYFRREGVLSSKESEKPVTLWGNNGGDTSLMEVADEKTIQQKLARLKDHFDVILINTDSLLSMNKAKEWISYADRVVVVFEAGSTIGESDRPLIQYLRSRGASLSGWVLTNTHQKTGGI